jgi:hypothetical protein
MKIGDLVKYEGKKGLIVQLKTVKVTGLNDYVLAKVEFEPKVFEWVNVWYLTKMEEDKREA